MNGIFLVMFFVLIKWILLLSGIEYLFHVEEFNRALIAKSIIEGPSFPLFDLQVDTYSGGSLVIGLLLTIVFKIFGQSLFAIKIVALFFSCCIAITLYVFCRRYFGKKVGLFSILFFTFSPPLVTKYFFFSMGFHVESILFSMLFMLIFFRIFYDENTNSFLFLLLGLIGGFGVWFNYVATLMVATGLLFWFVIDRLFFVRKSFFIFVTGFLLGFAPWIYSHIFYHLSGSPLNTKKLLPAFTREGFYAAWEKLLGLPAAFGNEYLFNKYCGVIYAVAHYIYYLLVIASIIWLIIKNRKRLFNFICCIVSSKKQQNRSLHYWSELFPFVYISIFITAYIISGFMVTDFMDYFGYRYLIPLYFFTMIIMALCFARINRVIGIVSTVLVILSGVIGNSQYIANNTTAFDPHPIDDQYCMYEYLTNKKIKGDANLGLFDLCFAFAKTLNPKYLGQFYLGLGELTGGLFVKNPDQYFKLYASIEEPFRPIFLTGAAKAVILMYGDFAISIDFIRHIEVSRQPLFYRMLGVSIGFRNTRYPERAFTLIDTMIEPQYRSFVYEGFGYVLGFCAPLYRPDITQAIYLFKQVPVEHRESFSLCLGSIGRYFIQKGYTMNECFQVLQAIPDTYKPYFYKAFGAHYMRDRRICQDCGTVITMIPPEYQSYFLEGIGFGIYDDQWLFAGLVAKKVTQLLCCSPSQKIALYKGVQNALGFQTLFSLDDEGRERLLRREHITF